MNDGFEWDEDKRWRNLEDHGVDFRDAALIFQNPVAEAEDKRDDYGEKRFRALGRVDDEYYLVAYTWRGNNRRIISAWKVDDDGKRRYQAILSEGARDAPREGRNRDPAGRSRPRGR